MANKTKKLINRAFGGRDPRDDWLRRTLTGLREGDRTELYTGLALTALAYIRHTRPQKELLFRKSIPEGSALVIRHTKRGAPRIEVVKPPKDSGV